MLRVYSAFVSISSTLDIYRFKSADQFSASSKITDQGSPSHTSVSILSPLYNLCSTTCEQFPTGYSSLVFFSWGLKNLDDIGKILLFRKLQRCLSGLSDFR
jgi:hypothetical protein